jgi:O-methyltransferase
MITKLKDIAAKILRRRDAHLDKWNNLKVAIGFIVANNIEGDYLEFGVYKGDSFVFVYKLFVNTFKTYKRRALRQHADSPFLNRKLRFFAFDSFEGLPDNDDKDIPLHWQGNGVMSYPRYLFESKLRSNRVDMNSVGIVPGYYEKSLQPDLYQKLNLTKASIIHIDCDFYESTKTCLDFITPLVTDGTIIVFDDYFYYKGHPKKGERGAFNEWLSQNRNLVSTEISKYYPGAAFIINLDNESIK